MVGIGWHGEQDLLDQALITRPKAIAVGKDATLFSYSFSEPYQA